MEGLLKCPHGLVTGCEERQGLKIYRHLQDGEACGLLNGLQLTPEEILLEMGQTFVSSGNFTALAPYVRGGELAEGYVPPQASTALNEFLLFFHASAAVRSLIYETVLTAAVSGDDITFKELLELAAEYPDVEVEVVPGLTAALSGAAVLGAPLAHDFCVISLSDRLTPWEVIEKRLACAAMGDFCVALYNPSSKGRPDYLQKAVRILLQNGKGAGTPCGVVRSIGRTGQQSSQMTLAELEHTTVDMFTTVFIGNSATHQVSGWMVTPRGYHGV